MERTVGEIFFEGNVKLRVEVAQNAISCKGCYYDQLVVRKKYTCEIGKIGTKKCLLSMQKCKDCQFGKVEKISQWECHRNLINAGLCQASFRDDGESVIFAEVC